MSKNVIVSQQYTKSNLEQVNDFPCVDKPVKANKVCDQASLVNVYIETAVHFATVEL